MEIKKYKLNKEGVRITKKYPYLSIFNTIRCDFKLSKIKEQRLKIIIKEIRELDKEMEDLFKCEKCFNKLKDLLK